MLLSLGRHDYGWRQIEPLGIESPTHRLSRLWRREPARRRVLRQPGLSQGAGRLQVRAGGTQEGDPVARDAGGPGRDLHR